MATYFILHLFNTSDQKHLIKSRHPEQTAAIVKGYFNYLDTY